MEYLEVKGFRQSLLILKAKGMYSTAVGQVWAVYGRINANESHEQVFDALTVTHRGETRIPNCVKYDLQGRARLVAVMNNGVCLFVFAGTHDDVDSWLDKNRGLDFVAHKRDGRVTVSSIRATSKKIGDAVIAEVPSDLAAGKLLERLSGRLRNRLLAGLDLDIREALEALDTCASDDELIDLAYRCSDSKRATLVHDVMASLRAGDLVNAKNLIDRFSDDARPIETLKPEEVSAIRSGEDVVHVKEIDPQLFRHFLDTATFEQWMLYLHPAQHEHVNQDYSGPGRLSGVSGSGKTCVIVHRALRLAGKYPGEKVLVLTLSSALATLIERLICALCGETRPANLAVSSVWQLCYEKLLAVERHTPDYYTRDTIAKNRFAESENVDEIWREFFECENNNHDADVMFDVVRTLALRGIYGRDYLRQEFDYIRSALSPTEREQYFALERSGRIVPLVEQYRTAVVQGLAGWERKMAAVGVIDDNGIVAALYRHLPTLAPEYRCVLVDEVQDLGTLELAVIRKLTTEGENDIFLCGDTAQSIHTKHADLKAAGIVIVGRASRLNQNYRNSREILEAAHGVLTRAFDRIPKGAAADIDVLAPEFANFSSPKPMLMKEESLLHELGSALSWLRQTVAQGGNNQRACIAVCGFSQLAIKMLGERLGLPLLLAGVDLNGGRIFLSDLEQTKGFEFDTVVIVNCALNVMPHPNLPPEESFRDLCRLYVAMTRAKKQLIVTYSGGASTFLQQARELFVESCFADHDVKGVDLGDLSLPDPAVPMTMNAAVWGRNGRAFLRSRDAVGMPELLQTAILKTVTGRDLMQKRPGRNQKQFEWKTFGGFAQAMKDPRARLQVLSDEAYASMQAHLSRLRSNA